MRHDLPVNHPARGLRRLSVEHLMTTRAIESFGGLPPGVRQPMQLLGAFKEAAPHLGLARLVPLVDFLFKFTTRLDWETGSTPLVWPSNEAICSALGVSLSQTKRLVRQIIDHGLVMMKDSPSRARFGRRGESGRILFAYGFNLSPMACRYAEFLTLAKQAREERAERIALRRRATTARQSIAQMLALADEQRLIAEPLRVGLARARELAISVRSAKTNETLGDFVKQIETLQKAACEWLSSEVGKTNQSRPQIVGEPPLVPTTQTFHSLEATVAQTGAAAMSECRLDAIREARQIVAISPGELVRLAPRLADYLIDPSPKWPDIVDAAELAGQQLGISSALFKKACQALGRYRAAVAIAVISTKRKDHFRSSPSSYLHAMVKRDEMGTLDLSASVFGLRQAAGYRRQRRRAPMGTAH
jgi:replication initiation protein RepC